MHLYKFGFVRIEEELKLDYSDVLFRPKRSTLQSRKDVNLLRTYRFKYSKNEWSGIPIMAANMDGVGELGIAEKLSDHNIEIIIHFNKSKSKAENLKNKLEKFGTKVYLVSGDLSKEKDIYKIILIIDLIEVFLNLC